MDCYLIRKHVLNGFFTKKNSLSTALRSATMALIFAASFSSSADVPCWLTNLNQQQKSIYGVSSKISASNRPALHFAKAKAVNNWLLSEGENPVNIKTNLAPLTEYQSPLGTLYFLAEFTQKNRIYSLVSDKANAEDFEQQCAIRECDIKSCSPSWLCQNDSEYISIIGMSEPTATANGQIKNTITNAQAIARTINNAHVKGYLDSLLINDSQVKVSNIQQRFAITDLTVNSPKITVGEMCITKGTLFSQITLNKHTISHQHNWMDQPLLGNTLGVVGYAKGQTSTGRLSGLLQVAVRRGLFEMAKAKNINVENDLKLALNEQGHYSLMRRSHQYTESIVSAYVADMKMQINDKLQPEIFIWLLENKDKS